MRTKTVCFRTLLLGFTHFLIDLACHAVLTAAAASFSDIPLILSVVIYNGLAFAFQFPIGAAADALGITGKLSSLGCVLVAVSAVLPSSVAVCIVAGIGNACFHVGGGREALLLGQKRASQIGMFVAPGAIGVFLGPKISTFFGLIRIALPLLLLALAAVYLLKKTYYKQLEQLQLPSSGLRSGRLLFIMLCMFVTVFLRAYMGTVTHYDLSPLLLTLCVFGGKFFGGFFADRFGAFRFSVWAQPIGVGLFAASLCCPYLAMPATFLFNTTMAITAFTLYRIQPALGGAMFGLTTLALYLGSLPKMLRLPSPFFTWWGLVLIGSASTALLLAGLALARGCDANG